MLRRLKYRLNWHKIPVMYFSDLIFLYAFLPAFVICYFVAGLWGKKEGSGAARNIVLLCFSLIFYAWGEPVLILLLICSALICYICAKTHKETAGIILLLLSLIIFKYGNLLTGLTGLAAYIPKIPLPLGISFYTFQGIAYLADVKRGRAKPQDSFYKLLLYISMFPQLIAGPIVRYTDISEDIDRRSVSAEDMAEGIRRIICGLGKKVILADHLSLIVEESMGADLSTLSTPMAWLGLLAYSLQIYFDFSAYSDMAIGMGRCMGFKFPENFDHPYISASATEFWRRWHMSLGSFFRDYVYIPLGGSRVSRLRRLFNIMLVWALTGFWHGASLNFMVWGLYFGVLILIEKELFFKEKDKERFKGLRHFTTPVILMLGWGIFYFEDFSKMKDFFDVLFGRGGMGSETLVMAGLSQNVFLLAVSLILCLPLPKMKEGTVTTAFRTLYSVAILVLAVLFLIGSTSHPFLYTRF